MGDKNGPGKVPVRYWASVTGSGGGLGRCMTPETQACQLYCI